MSKDFEYTVKPWNVKVMISEEKIQKMYEQRESDIKGGRVAPDYYNERVLTQYVIEKIKQRGLNIKTEDVSLDHLLMECEFEDFYPLGEQPILK